MSSLTAGRTVGLRARLASLYALMRVGTCVAAGALCLLGDRLSQAPDAGVRMLAAVASIASIVAFAQAANDVADRDVDRRTKPHRPLPSGMLTVHEAKAVAATCAASGVLLATVAGPWQVLFGVLLVGLSWAYSYGLKGTVLLGNIVVAALASTAVLYGAVLGGVSALALLVQAVVLSFSLAFEVLKTARDAEGDAAAGLTTVATRFGVPVAARLAAALSVVAAAVAVTPALLAAHPLRYLAAMGVLAIAPTLAAAALLLARDDLDRPFRLLRVAWTAGVVSLLLL